MRLPLSSAALLLAMTGLSVASVPTLEDNVRSCRLERDPPKRLDCYDRLPLTEPSVNAVAPASPMPPAPVAAPTANQGFGLPIKKPEAKPEPPQAIESTLEGRFLGWQPNSRLSLSNGQVWQIADDSSAAYDLRQPKVRIERGRFGGFFMTIEGVSQTARVRRLY